MNATVRLEKINKAQVFPQQLQTLVINACTYFNKPFSGCHPPVVNQGGLFKKTDG